MFSLHATKVFNSIEGGLLTYQNSSLKSKLEQIKNFGFDENNEPQMVGTNAKMNEFQAIMGLLNLKYYKDEINKRKRIAKRYRENLNSIKGIEYLDRKKENVKYNYSYFPVLVTDSFNKNRDELLNQLNKYNIYPKKYYSLCSNFEGYNEVNIVRDDLSVAEYVSSRILTLPIYGELTFKQVDYICAFIKTIREK
jgi:dTDP-4-amino-4,6-dideoxygalactose transaminase